MALCELARPPIGGSSVRETTCLIVKRVAVFGPQRPSVNDYLGQVLRRLAGRSTSGTHCPNLRAAAAPGSTAASSAYGSRTPPRQRLEALRRARIDTSRKADPTT